MKKMMIYGHLMHKWIICNKLEHKHLYYNLMNLKSLFADKEELLSGIYKLNLLRNTINGYYRNKELNKLNNQMKKIYFYILQKDLVYRRKQINIESTMMYE